MSRVKVSSSSFYPNPEDTNKADESPKTRPLLKDPGLEGPYSQAVSTSTDSRVRDELNRILTAAREIRPVLRERQAETEINGHYAVDIHEYFLKHGFYKILLPKKWGGLELDVPSFFAMIAEVARGCPSTAWCLSLSTAHTLTLSSYWPEAVQKEIFEQRGYMIAPASGQIQASEVVPVEGGYKISGTWRYCSGAPYSTHFFPTVLIPETESEPTYRAWLVVDRDQYEILEDWGRVIGMRGSGSNGITMKDVFVPSKRVIPESRITDAGEPSIGYHIHKNATYSGVFFGFAEGEVAAVAAGLGYAATDEYERIIRTSKAPYDPSGSLRVDNDDWRRVLGMSIAKVDAANAALIESGRLYEEYSRRLVEGIDDFDGARAMRLNNAYFVVEELIWEALQHMVRTAGTGFSADGQAMQRYFRDIWTTMSRTDQFEFFASPAVASHLEGQANFEESEATKNVSVA